MKIKERFSIACLVIFAVSLVLLFISKMSAEYAEFINIYVCQRIRSVLSKISSVFPFSVFEILVISSPLLVFCAIRSVLVGRENTAKRFWTVVGILSLFPSLYILTLGISYESPSPFSEYGKAVSDSDLSRVANLLCDMVNEEALAAPEEASFDLISREALKAYDVGSLCSSRTVTLPRPKPLLSSGIVNYTGALAIYSFMTGEVNINVKAPNYTLPFTVAHELAHSAGFSAESDANFLAFLAAYNSKSNILRYSVFLSVLDYMLDELKVYQKSEYKLICEKLCKRAFYDLDSYREYLNKYSKNHIYKTFDSLNSLHLDAWDTNKRHSYSAISRYVTNYLTLA